MIDTVGLVKNSHYIPVGPRVIIIKGCLIICLGMPRIVSGHKIPIRMRHKFLVTRKVFRIDRLIAQSDEGLARLVLHKSVHV